MKDHDPGRIRHARERKGLSRAGLANAINDRLHLPIATYKTILRIENGQPVKPTRYRPVLIELELTPAPSHEKPRPKQAPGGWVRELREAHGIPPTTFFLRAHYPGSKQRLSRTTLNAIEEDRRVPSFQMLDAIATGFERSHVDIHVRHLERAWILHGGEAVEAAWGPGLVKELRERILAEEPWQPAAAIEGLSIFASHLRRALQDEA